jgi:hypothetical protein
MPSRPSSRADSTCPGFDLDPGLLQKHLPTPTQSRYDRNFVLQNHRDRDVEREEVGSEIIAPFSSAV